MISIKKISTNDATATNQFATALLNKSITGLTIYVDSVNGVDERDGLSWETAVKTITRGYNIAVDGGKVNDVIFLKGSFTEEVTIAKDGVTIIGVGTRPKQAQWTGEDNGLACIITGDYVAIDNIYFRPPAYVDDAAVAAISLSGAQHAVIRNCRFQGKTGSYNAIYSPAADSDNVTIEDNEFMYMNTATYGAAILGVETGGLSYSGWKIRRNIFNSCVTCIKLNARVCLVEGNKFFRWGLNASSALAEVTTLMIDLYGSTGLNSGGNLVSGNWCENGYVSSLFKPGVTGDQWVDNWEEPRPVTGRAWFVDSTNGSATNVGQSWVTAFSTITLAQAAASAGDTIYIKGSFTEAVTCNKAGLRFIGAGTGPQQAIWTGAADAKCLTITAEAVEVNNICFRPPAYSASRATCAIYLNGANYCKILNCRFQGKTGSQAAIHGAEADSDNVTIQNCEFLYLSTATYGAGIKITETVDAYCSAWKILDCYFNSCVTAISMPARNCLIKGCTFMDYGSPVAGGAPAAVMTLGINLRGANASTMNGANSVVDNFLAGTYSETLYKDATGDMWANTNIGGPTVANPAP